MFIRLTLSLSAVKSFSFNASRARLSTGEGGELAAQWINLFL